LQSITPNRLASPRTLAHQQFGDLPITLLFFWSLVIKGIINDKSDIRKSESDPANKGKAVGSQP
jgi:hypothetical protein